MALTSFQEFARCSLSWWLLEVAESSLAQSSFGYREDCDTHTYKSLVLSCMPCWGPDPTLLTPSALSCSLLHAPAHPISKPSNISSNISRGLPPLESHIPAMGVPPRL